MKKLIFILLLLSLIVNAQSWNSAITTTVDVSNATRYEMQTSKFGNNIAVETNGQLKVYLVDTDGGIVRTSVIDNNVTLSNITGDANNIYVVYKKTTRFYGKKSVNGGASWTDLPYVTVGSAITKMDAVYFENKLHVAYNYYNRIKYRQYRANNNIWGYYASVSGSATGENPHISVSKSQNKVYVGWGHDDYSAKSREYDVATNSWGSIKTINYNSNSALLGSSFVANGADATYIYMYYYQVFNGSYYVNQTYVAKVRKSDYVKVSDYGITSESVNVFNTQTADNKLHSAYYWTGVLGGYAQGSNDPGIRHMNYSNSAESTIYNLYTPVDNVLISSAYNDLYVLWANPSDNILKYMQYDTTPSIPQNLTIAWYNGHPKLTWNTDAEPDMQSYKIWKYAEGSATIAATITHNSSNSTHSWIDGDVEPAGKFDPFYTYYYKVKAVDNSNNESAYSNQVSITGTGGIWKKNSEGEDNVTITSYALNSNYPNPFNPTTNISYQIPQDGFVNLVVYNALGQQVAELVNQNQSMGKYTVKFNATNLPSGVYIYKLQAGEFNSVKKMLLTK